MTSLQELLEYILARIDTSNPQECLGEIGSYFVDYFKADACHFYFIDRREGRINLISSSGSRLATGSRIDSESPVHGGLKERAIELARGQRYPIIINDAGDFHRHFGSRQAEGAVGIGEVELPFRPFLILPLYAFEELDGLAYLVNHRVHFERHHLLLLRPMLNLAALALPRINEENLIKLVEICIRFLEEKDPYTHGHSLRVMHYSLALAEELDFSKADKAKLRICALLHDIGKVIIRDSILSKNGRLDQAEYASIKLHPTIGSSITMKISDNLADKILSHHEHFDGSGYPQGLEGQAIPLISRIIAIADAFDAMTSKRPYREQWSIEHALAEIEAHAGTQFDPDLVTAWKAMFEKGVLTIIKV
jgi:putative nucleotidyltransferase with HDIG domain